jgi:hypothetical protein
MFHAAAMKGSSSILQRIADHLWTALTLVLALILAAPAAMVVSAPFMKSQPAFVYDRYGCPVPGTGLEQSWATDQCGRGHATGPAADLPEPAAEPPAAE